MKAIYISNIFDPTKDLEKLNQELKDCHRIIWYKKVNESTNLPGGILYYGTLLIVDNYTRKDKLKKIKKINEKGTDNSSL